MRRRPSPGFGLDQATGVWKLVVAIWLAPVVAFLPARAVVWFATGDTLAALPDEGLPTGEALLILIELLRPVAAPLVVAALSGWFALWAWTVLWHAGVVRWLLFAGRDEVRLAEILGHGLMGWWRWARLGLTSVAALLLSHAVIWRVVIEVVDRSSRRPGDDSAPYWLAAGVALSLVLVVLGWLATLRGSWLLGAGDRRSAVLAWFAGLLGSIRQPLSSVVTLTVWAIPGFAVLIVPLVMAWQLEVLRGGAPAAIVELVAGLLGAFCWVGLFFSFAPATGLVGETPSKES